MGITKNCRSSSWRYSNEAVEITNANAGSTLSVNANEITTVQDANTTQVNGRTEAQINLGENSQNYWSHSSKFTGNLLGIYEGSVSFTVSYTTDDDRAEPLQAKLIIVGRNQTQFYFKAGTVPVNAYLDITVGISMENMLMDDTGNETTRSDLLLGLTDVEMVLIPASYYPYEHKSKYVHHNHFVQYNYNT